MHHLHAPLSVAALLWGQVKFVSLLRDVEWLTDTCMLGWTTLGIWPPECDGTELGAIAVNHGVHSSSTWSATPIPLRVQRVPHASVAVSRHSLSPLCESVCAASRLLVAAETSGALRLFNYPVITPNVRCVCASAGALFPNRNAALAGLRESAAFLDGAAKPLMRSHASACRHARVSSCVFMRLCSLVRLWASCFLA